MNKEDYGSKILGAILRMVKRGGLNFARKRVSLVLNGIIRGIRYTFLLHYIILYSCFLGSLSLFATLFLISVQLSENQSLHLTWPLGMSGGLAVLCGLLLIYSIRESTWRRAFSPEEFLDSIFGTGKGYSCKTPEISPEAIEEAVERVLARKLR